MKRRLQLLCAWSADDKSLLRQSSYRLLRLLAVAVTVAVSAQVLLQNGLSFDGAFHAQSAFNLYQGNGLRLDYLDQGWLQINLPFQILNGLFLTVFGRHFPAANLANLVFYWMLLGFALHLSKTRASPLPLLAFMVISYFPAFREYGFGGYGELPALTLALIGAELVICRTRHRWRVCLGAALLASAIATKWVLLLVLVPLVPVCLVLWRRGEGKTLARGAGCFLLVLAGCMVVQYHPLNLTGIGRLVQAMLAEGVSADEGLVARLDRFMRAYISRSGLPWLAWGKIVLAGMLVIGLCAQTRAYIKHRQLPNDHELMAAFLFVFTTTYFLDWFLMHSFSWYRRVFNADILLFLSLSVLPSLFRRLFWQRLAKQAMLVVFLLYAGVYVPLVLGRITWDTPALTLESALRAASADLPETFEGCGYGWWQSPRWSFLSGRKFRNLFESPVLYRTLVQKIPVYLFFEPENMLQPDAAQEVERVYDLRESFMYHDFRYARVQGFRPQGRTFVTGIDFAKGDYENSIRGFWEHEQNALRHSKIEAAVFLDNTARFPSLQLEFQAGAHLQHVDLRGFLVSEEGTLLMHHDIPVRNGYNRVVLKMPSHTPQRVVFYLSHLQGVRRLPVDQRLHGITVLKVVLTGDPGGAG